MSELNPKYRIHKIDGIPGYDLPGRLLTHGGLVLAEVRSISIVQQIIDEREKYEAEVELLRDVEKAIRFKHELQSGDSRSYEASLAIIDALKAVELFRLRRGVGCAGKKT